ncbi:MAG TPA: VOC family protein [Casimicrobiaceae bacterium]|jgi:catechol 2,3-dioxygenase-like lactoylglutathione lyase family enzyme
MLHHLSLGTADLKRSTDFYDATLAELGYTRVWTADAAVGYGPPGDDDKLAIKLRSAPAVAPGPGFHIAFAAPDRDSVSRFHQAALRSGGRDNGPPGLRPQYGDDYYAAFVLDPDGYAIEAVCTAGIP